MAQTSTVQDQVNAAAVDKLSAARGKSEVAHYFLVTEDRDTVKAIEWIDKAITDLEAAKTEITAGAARELRRPVEITEQFEGADL